MKTEMSSDEILKSDHGISATPIRVLMLRGTYPKTW